MTNVVNRFAGIYEFLSNFYPAPVTLDGVVYPTVENAFQAAKTGDMALRRQFAQCSPGYAKKLGRQVALRSDWEAVKDGIMYELLKQKFAAAPVWLTCCSAPGAPICARATCGTTITSVLARVTGACSFRTRTCSA